MPVLTQIIYKNKYIEIGSPQIRENFTPIFAKHPTILAAHLFGSTANQTVGANSDVDVALRLDKGLSVDQQLELRLELMDDVETVFKRSADIVILNNASLKMIRQVLTHGEMLFARGEAAERLYAFHKQKEYFDFKYYIEKDRQELKSKTALRHYRPRKVVPPSKHER